MIPGPAPVITSKPGLGEQPPDLLRGLVLRVVGRRARRAEDGDAALHAGERVEASMNSPMMRMTRHGRCA
jgi:hypothetical protein